MDSVSETHHQELFGTLTKQLERMRSMHYGYYSQFFTAIHLFTILILAIIALSLWPQMSALILALPFFVIYAGSFCAFLLSYNLFARVYAIALEKRLNHLLGEEALVAHLMEDVFIGRTATPKFVAFDLAAPATALSAITVSYLISGVVLEVVGIYRSWQILPIFTSKFPLLHLYWPLLAVWGLLHLAYLLWYFLSASHEKKITQIVNDAYGVR